MTVKAIYETGVFKPEEPVHLEEHRETGWKAAEASIDFLDDAPADMAEHHDRYLYGRSDA